MNLRERQAAAASALLSAPVLRSAMHSRYRSLLVQSAVAQLVEAGLARGASTVRTLIWRCDRWLSRHHRGDLVYRKAITAAVSSWGGILLPEFRAGRSIIDLASVADALHAIEIKSDLDNDSRLSAQLMDYQTIAPLVSVIGPNRIIERVGSTGMFDSVGLYWLDTTGEVRMRRPAGFMPDRLNSGAMMRSLRRDEYLGVLSELGFPLAGMPNTRIFSAALETSCSIDPLRYHLRFASRLRLRRPRAGRSAIARVPAPVRPAVLKLDPTPLELASLHDWLNQEIAYVHA